MRKKVFIFFLLSTSLSSSWAQQGSKMKIWQDSLVGIGTKMFRSPAEPERLESTFKFVKTLVSALKEPNSFYFGFDALNMISIVSSPDNTFRIFTWNVPLQDGSFLYYGAIQHKTADGKIKLTPLLDKTFEIPRPEEKQLSNQTWYGAQYYAIVALGNKQYALLGWKGHRPDYTQKVIEILNLQSADEVLLGASVFSDNSKNFRRIFSYTSQASMYLRFNPSKARIEFDHLVPADPGLKDNFKYYGPDLSYDAYQVLEGRLKLQEDIEVQNVERGNEDKYIDPLRPDKRKKSGL